MRKHRINNNETFSDLSKISKKFWKTKKFLVNQGDILKKYKCKKNVGNI